MCSSVIGNMHFLALFMLLAPPPPDDLFQTISKLDTKLFDAYNTCDIDTFASLLEEDLEFYHDVTGLSKGRQSTVDAVKQNICGKVHRDLVPGALRVYPLNEYGAVETGIHLFCDSKLKKCPDGSGVGRFMMLWQNSGGVWKITRVVSYDHCNRCSKAGSPEGRALE